MAPFIYCLNTSTIRPSSLPEKISVAAQAGYAAIELWHDDIDSFCRDGGEILEVRRMLDDNNLSLASTIYLRGWFETTGVVHAKNLEECKRRMEQATTLGAELCIASPPVGKADLELGAKNYAELLDIGHTIGVKPSLEFLGFVEEFNRLELAVDIFRNIDRSDASVVIDPFHLFLGGSGIDAMASSGIRGDEIGILHFNDAPSRPERELQTDANRVMPGEGCLDLKTYLQDARDLGYHGPLSLELFNEQLWELPPLEVATRGLHAMREVVES